MNHEGRAVQDTRYHGSNPHGSPSNVKLLPSLNLYVSVLVFGATHVIFVLCPTQIGTSYVGHSNLDFYFSKITSLSHCLVKFVSVMSHMFPGHRSS